MHTHTHTHTHTYIHLGGGRGRAGEGGSGLPYTSITCRNAIKKKGGGGAGVQIPCKIMYLPALINRWPPTNVKIGNAGSAGILSKKKLPIVPLTFWGLNTSLSRLLFGL